jgi:small-conductance mechanosensitive channel
VSPDDDGNAVLSQDNIDALVSATGGSDGETAAPAAAPPTQAAPPPAAPAAEPAAADPDPAPASGAGGPTLADVAQRLAKLEATVAKLSQNGGAGGQPDAKVQALTKQLQALNGRVNEILQHLPNTLGYGARATFQCGACSAQGMIASHVMCTQCGTETVIGWWPQQ